ncbi:MAG: nitroreductase family protein [Beijerinckiaceae bacterium]|nr:nitroreductase family protein [Beijerinckiaceae bacterium]
MTSPAPHFDDAFREKLEQLLVWRRNVRHFRTDPVPRETIEHLLDLTQMSSSVGKSQPWRWVEVRSQEAKAAVRASLLPCNAASIAVAVIPREGLGEAIRDRLDRAAAPR